MSKKCSLGEAWRNPENVASEKRRSRGTLALHPGYVNIFIFGFKVLARGTTYATAFSAFRATCKDSQILCCSSIFK